MSGSIHRTKSRDRNSQSCYHLAVETIVTSNPKVMHGVPCFAGTRVAVKSLFDHLEAGYSIDQFVAQFPTVRREQVIALLQQLKRQTAAVSS